MLLLQQRLSGSEVQVARRGVKAQRGVVPRGVLGRPTKQRGEQLSHRWLHAHSC
jgi:hypothetical protein